MHISTLKSVQNEVSMASQHPDFYAIPLVLVVVYQFLLRPNHLFSTSQVKWHFEKGKQFMLVSTLMFFRSFQMPSTLTPSPGLHDPAPSTSWMVLTFPIRGPWHLFSPLLGRPLSIFTHRLCLKSHHFLRNFTASLCAGRPLELFNYLQSPQRPLRLPCPSVPCWVVSCFF